MYFVEMKERNTDQKYVVPTGVIPYNAEDVIEAIETALQVARRLRERNAEHYKNNFNENWPETRKENFRKLNSWAVRVKDDDGKTILLLKDSMF